MNLFNIPIDESNISYFVMDSAKENYALKIDTKFITENGLIIWTYEEKRLRDISMYKIGSDF